MTITFWNRNKRVSKTFKNTKQLKKFVIKHGVYMFDYNGITHTYIGGIC